MTYKNRGIFVDLEWLLEVISIAGSLSNMVTFQCMKNGKYYDEMMKLVATTLDVIHTRSRKLVVYVNKRQYSGNLTR